MKVQMSSESPRKTWDGEGSPAQQSSPMAAVRKGHANRRVTPDIGQGVRAKRQHVVIPLRDARISGMLGLLWPMPGDPGHMWPSVSPEKEDQWVH